MAVGRGRGADFTGCGGDEGLSRDRCGGRYARMILPTGRKHWFGPALVA